MAYSGRSPTFSRPPRKVSSSTTSMPVTVAPARSTRRQVAATVPPVARTSSTTSTRCPGWSALSCISRTADPYSRVYSSRSEGPGSLPDLRTGTKPMPRWWATAAPMMNPRASIPTTTSTRPAYRPATSWTTAANASPSASCGVKSLNRTPGCGKSGMSRIRLSTSSVTDPSGIVSASTWGSGAAGSGAAAGPLVDLARRCGPQVGDLSLLGVTVDGRVRRRVLRVGRARAPRRGAGRHLLAGLEPQRRLVELLDGRLVPAQVDQQRRGDEDRRVCADRDPDEQGQAEVEQGARAEQCEADDEDRGDREEGHNG